MKTERNILIAFILNLSFSVFEIVGGIFTGSVAILSDAVHDAGDALSIGISYILEKKSKKQPDETHTYGYARYSVLGGFITTLILLVGSVAVIYNAIGRIVKPTQINYNGMIVFAVVGVCINFCAAFLTRDGESVNQKAVNLHMLEDVLGWAVVLVGAVVMRFTDFALIDPIMSIGVSLFILIGTLRNLKAVADLFLEKVPRNIDVAKIRERIEEIDGVIDVHHIHVWSMDGQSALATMHIVTDSEPEKIKSTVRQKLHEHGIDHITIELESSTTLCHKTHCRLQSNPYSAHAHHHHSHH